MRSPTLSRPSRVATWLVAGALLLASAPASAESRFRHAANEAALGAAAAGCTALYFPIKLAIGATGALVGGAAWVVTGGENEPALEIVERTGGGDWIVTQSHLRGDRRFSVLEPESDREVARRN